jgi:hypothetical protein
MRFVRLSILFFSILFITGCIKKGEEDPLISIYKRSTRILGKWKLKELQIQDYDKDINGKLNIVVRTLLKDKYTETRGVDTTAATYFGTMESTLEILEDGTYKYNENVSTNGLSYSRANPANPKWSWNDNFKKTELILSDFKSFDITGLHSSQLVLTITDINNLNSNNSHSYVERWVFKNAN